MFPSRRRPLAAALALLLATAGCGSQSGDSGPQAQASGVTAEALQAAAQDEDVRRFYEARQWQSAWNEQGAQQLRQVLQGAVRHGLNPADFALPPAQGQDPVRRDVALTKAALAYAGVLAHGKTDPARLFSVYTLPRNEVDVPAGLAQAVARGDVPQWIESLAPQDEEYRALSQAYVQLMQSAGEPQPQAGQGNGRAADAKAAAPKQKNGQRKVADAAPVAPRDRAAVLAVNMERRRWLARNPSPTRIDVNTAASFLRYFRDNGLVDQRVVVTGEPGWETPQLGSPIYRLVANPDWTVPVSIERQELGGLSAAALARRNMTRKNGHIVQEPGPQNALGLVKFDMRNDHAIYLHDTPSKWAFQRDERHLSHGCVRVQDAVGFAHILAEQSGKVDQLDRALRDSAHNTVSIALDQEIPVRLLYFTAYLDNGRLMFVPDVYGWDAKVAEALRLPVPPASRASEARADQRRQQRGADVGP